MSCNNDKYHVGDIIDDAQIINSSITASTIVDSEFRAGTITGGVTLDEASMATLATQLCPLIQDCVTVPPGSIAGVFNNCTGTPHVAGANIPTCGEMTTSINSAISSYDTTIRAYIDQEISAVEAGLAITVATDTPPSTSGTELPTTLIGVDRTALMARPDGYFMIQGRRVPFYNPIVCP